jgi:Tfp pilus assembly PilM family ATPase
MLFSTKNKGYFVEANDHTILLARTSGTAAPFTVEEVTECPVGETAVLTESIRRIQPVKASSGYLHAVCGVHPSRRIVRRATLDLKRVREAGYFAEVLTTQFRIEADKYTVFVINAPDGTDFDVNKPTQKEALFCGLPADDVVTVQDGLLAGGIYPERLELGSVAMLGAMVDYLAFRNAKTPTLVLEIGSESTHSFIVSSGGVEASRPIPQGLESMVPVVQQELKLKDAESARKLFFSNTFDFTGMGPLLVKKLLKELQSSIGFYEVQTGQSVGQVLCTSLPPKLAWLEGAISTALGITGLKLDLPPWLQSRRIALAETVPAASLDARWLGLLGLMTRYHQTTDAAIPEKKA